MQINKEIIGQATKWTINFVKKNAPHLLAGTAIAGVGFTSFFAVRGVIRAKEIIEDEKNIRKQKLLSDCEESNLYPENGNIPPNELMEEQTSLTKKETFKLIWKPLLPLVISGVVTCGSIIWMDIIHSGRYGAAIAVASGAQKVLEDYQKKNIELFGEKQHKKIIDENAKDAVQNNELLKDDCIIDTGTGNMILLDIENSRPIKGSIEAIERAVNELNKEIFLDTNAFYNGFRSLNDFYDEIGIYQSYFKPKNGEYIGWDKNHPIEIEFTSVLFEDKTAVTAFAFKNRPLEHWQLEEHHNF